MKKKILVVLFALALSVNLRSQVTIGGLSTPKAGALLDLNSTTTGGLVLSNVDLTDLSVIPGGDFVNIPTTQDRNQELAGMIVYNTYAANGVGVHLWNGDDWIKLCAPPAPGAITFSDTTICGSGATFTAKIDSVKGATNYVWKLPEGLTGTSNDTIITITATTAGSYPADSITVRAVSSCGGGTRRPSTQDVTVYARPVAPTNPSSATVNSGSSFTFSATPPADCTIDWYDAATAGTEIQHGATSFSETLTTTKKYYAESRNTTTGCVSATRLAVTGTVHIPGCVPGTFNLTGKVKFINTDTTVSRNGIIFSAPVKITASKTTFDAGSSEPYKADYRNHQVSSSDPADDTGTFGSWFSWCMVAQYADVLCPSPWRVPTRGDFSMYAAGSESYSSSISAIHNGLDGWQSGVSCSNDGHPNNPHPDGYYWSSTPNGTDKAYYAASEPNYFFPQFARIRDMGFTLRCVK
jgi:uncharacterized protein (TIGR02145 family)